MNHQDEDLYTRHQTLTALVNVLVHDLRNPLHSATLLVEAMGSPSADLNTLRNKLRAQITKLDGLIAETNASMRELALEARIESVDLDALVGSVVERYAKLKAGPAAFDLPAKSGLTVAADGQLITTAILEIAGVLAEQARSQDPGSTARVTLSIDEPEAGTVRLAIGDLDGAYAATLAKAPFAIAGGGVRLAVARSLAQNAGATLRLEQGADGVTRFAFFLPRPT